MKTSQAEFLRIFQRIKSTLDNQDWIRIEAFCYNENKNSKVQVTSRKWTILDQAIFLSTNTSYLLQN